MTDVLGAQAAADEICNFLVKNISVAGMPTLGDLFARPVMRRAFAHMILDHVAIGLVEFMREHYSSAEPEELNALVKSLKSRIESRALSADKIPGTASGAHTPAPASTAADRSAPSVNNDKLTPDNNGGSGRSDAAVLRWPGSTDSANPNRVEMCLVCGMEHEVGNCTYEPS